MNDNINYASITVTKYHNSEQPRREKVDFIFQFQGMGMGTVLQDLAART